MQSGVRDEWQTLRVLPDEATSLTGERSGGGVCAGVACGVVRRVEGIGQGRVRRSTVS